MPYGPRVIRALAFGLLLFLISAVLIWPVDPEGSGLHYKLTDPFFFNGWGLWVFLTWAVVSNTPISKRIRVTFRKLFTSPLGTAAKAATVLGVVLLVASAVWSFVSGIMTAGDFANQHRDQEGQVLRLVFLYLIAFIPIALLVLPVQVLSKIEAIKSHPTFRHYLVQGRGGGATFAGPQTYDKYEAYNVGAGKNSVLKGLYFGRTLFSDDFAQRDIVIEDDGHVLTVGQPGSGKSVTAVWPNLALYGGSAVVIDPKGEHCRMFCGRRQWGAHGSTQDDFDALQVREYQQEKTAEYYDRIVKDRKFMASKGTDTRGITRVGYGDHLENHHVFILDPFEENGPYPTHRYNPLDEIDIESPIARKLISAISGACIVPTGGENKFWEESARSVLDGTIAHVLSRFPKKYQTLPIVADLLLGIDPKTGYANPNVFDDLLIEMRKNRAAGGLPQLGAATLDDMGDRAKGSVTAELRNAMKWATDPKMREVLASSDFKFADVGDGRTTVFVVLPFGMMVEQMRWLRMTTEVSLRILESRENKKDPRILYILDELPQYGKHLKIIKEGMVTLRSAGVKLWTFVQNANQLYECFGEEGSKNFQSGGTIQVFGISDDTTADWVSKKLGQHRIKEKQGRGKNKKVDHREESLVSSTEVERVLGKTKDIQYLFRSGNPPMRLRRVAYKAMTIEGDKFQGLGLQRFCDEHLTGDEKPAKSTADSMEDVT